MDIRADAFDVVVADDDEVMIYFRGRVGLSPRADAALEGRDLAVARGGYRPLRFPGLSDADLAAVARAPRLWAARITDAGNEVSELSLRR